MDAFLGRVDKDVMAVILRNTLDTFDVVTQKNEHEKIHTNQFYPSKSLFFFFFF